MTAKPYSHAHYQEAKQAASLAAQAADSAHRALEQAQHKHAMATKGEWDTEPAYREDVRQARAVWLDLQAKADAADEALRRLQEALSLEEQEAYANQP